MKKGTRSLRMVGSSSSAGALASAIASPSAAPVPSAAASLWLYSSANSPDRWRTYSCPQLPTSSPMPRRRYFSEARFSLFIVIASSDSTSASIGFVWSPSAALVYVSCSVA